MAKKVRIKKRNVGILIGSVLVVVIAVIGIMKWKEKLDYQASDEYKLLEIGYSDEDVDFLLEHLEKNDIDEIIKNKTLNENISKFFKQEYFIENNLDDYLKYASERPDLPLSEIVAIINVNATEEWYSTINDSDTSLGSSLMVNKFYKLPDDYEPTTLVDIKNWYAYPDAKQMDEDAYYAFISMHNDAALEDIKLVINYSYRSGKEQTETYDYYKSQYGSEYADGISARPGHSEHQTGLAIDILIPTGYDKSSFDTSPTFEWLQSNAHKYGYILRYPKDKEYLTGYSYESWHYRYVGVDIATYIYDHNITFDEYYAYFIEG